MNKRKYIISLSIACLALGACKKSAFVSTNLNPDVLYSVDPADQFLAAAAGCQDDFEYYYDVYRAENLWMQYATGPAGNTPGFARVGDRAVKGVIANSAVCCIDNLSCVAVRSGVIANAAGTGPVWSETSQWQWYGLGSGTRHSDSSARSHCEGCRG